MSRPGFRKHLGIDPLYETLESGNAQIGRRSEMPSLRPGWALRADTD